MVAMGQILIYSGAIVVLFLFVVALLPQGGAEGSPGVGRIAWRDRGRRCAAGGIAAWLSIGGALPPPAAPPAADVVEIGRSLFGRLIVPFELTAPLLLVAIVGAVVDLATAGARCHERPQWRDPGPGDERRACWRIGAAGVLSAATRSRC